MKRFAMLSALALCFAVIAPAASAQDKDKDTKNHGNLGLYFDFTRPQDTGLNMFGVGGRLGVNIRKHVVLEGEMAYDFERTKTQTITFGGVTNTFRSNLRILHALFGPKIQTTGPVRFFALAKGGFVNFGVGGPVTAGVINNQIGNIVDGDTKAAVYPGGGVEFNRGWLGIRIEAGDEIIFLNNGTSNNFRATFGPQIRF
jgi:opacity protein-like surface antigen